MNAKTESSMKQTKSKTSNVSPEYVVHQLNDDVRNSVLVISVLINLFVLISWLVIQVTTRYDAALINYFSNR